MTLILAQPQLWRMEGPPTMPYLSTHFTLGSMPTRGYIVAIGLNGEMLLWNGVTWVPHYPIGGTGGWGELSYDVARDRLVKVGRLGETYEWDGTAWAQRGFGPGGSVYDIAYHSGIRKTVWYGYPASSLCLQDSRTFLWDGSTWTQHLGTQPTGWARLAYDSSRQHVILYGGHLAGPSICTPQELTWIFDGSRWYSLSVFGIGYRAYPCLGFDGNILRVVLYGGQGISSYPNDTWTWSGAAWQRATSEGTPSPREGADLAFDYKRMRLVTLGGLRDFVGTPNLETWTFLPRHISASAVVPPGSTAVIRWNSPNERDRLFGMAASLSRASGISLIDGRTVPLDLDGLFTWSFLSQSL